MSTTATEFDPGPGYDVIHRIGEGGMGLVYRARDRNLGREVAIKIIRDPESRRDEKQLRAEAQAMATLQPHRNVAAVYHYVTDSVVPFIVSEYIDGDNLAMENKPLGWQRVLKLAKELAGGLAHLHDAGLVHRDIKPANIVLAANDRPVFVDFGLAKKLSEATDDLSGNRSQRYRGSTWVPPFWLGDASRPVESTESASEPSDRAQIRAQGSPPVSTWTTAARPTRRPAGTWSYMAPEVRWGREQASKRADVYSLGLVLYELCAGHRPVLPTDDSDADGAPAPQGAGRSLRALLAGAGAKAERFADVIGQCLAHEQSERFADGTALQTALEPLEPDPPYQGLAALDRDTRQRLFGREDDIRDVVERLHDADRPMVVVHGPSGAGKSSLLKAGVLPAIAAHGLDAGRAWRSCQMRPGPEPLAALSATLTGALENPDELTPDVVDGVPELLQRLRDDLGSHAGLVLVIDQLEELFTIGDRTNTARFGQALSRLLTEVDGLRVVASVRDSELGAILQLIRTPEPQSIALQPLATKDLRRAIVEPARQFGVYFESPALIDELVAYGAEECGLPLLQLVLSTLWQHRDQHRNIITSAALTGIGGLQGALQTHADSVLRGLSADHENVARQILLQLVTEEREPVFRSLDDLVQGDPARAQALAELDEHRLVTRFHEGETAYYQLAHSSLIEQWDTLKNWLDEDSLRSSIEAQLARAAMEWQRQGRSKRYLWTARQVAGAHEVRVERLSPQERAFLDGSQKRVVRARWLRRTLMLALMALASALYNLPDYLEERVRRDQAHAYVALAHDELVRADDAHKEFRRLRQLAHDCFHDFVDKKGESHKRQQEKWRACEEMWWRALERGDTTDEGLRGIHRQLDMAYRLAPGDQRVRNQLAYVIDQRARLAALRHQEREVADLVAQLDTLDSTGAHAESWHRTTDIAITTIPPGHLIIERQESVAQGRVAWRPWQRIHTPTRVSLEPGSYVLSTPERADGTPRLSYPLRVLAGESEPRELTLTIPSAAELPDGYVYVAPGSFPFGFGGASDHEITRVWLDAPPLHERWHEYGFFIAENETTYAQWMEYLRSLSPGEREQRMPASSDDDMSVRLVLVDGEFQFHYRPDRATQERRYLVGERVNYPARTRLVHQSWLQFPVTGISAEDVKAYARWLDESGRVPGARMCKEDEWARAARGADSYLYARGDRLSPEDANYDMTYGNIAGSRGFNEVGATSAERSPFGLADVYGNAAELNESLFDGENMVLRGGSYFRGARTNAIANRYAFHPQLKRPYVGFRLCAEPPERLR